MGDESSLFTSEEQVQAAERIRQALEPLGIGLLVLGRMAMLLRFQIGGSSKDVDLHPFPLEDKDVAGLADVLVRELGPDGRYRWEADGRSSTVMVPVSGRTVPVELMFGGEDWIDEHVLKDALRTARDYGGLLVPSPEHLFVMKAEAAIDRRGEGEAGKFRQDMVMIKESVADEGSSLDLGEIDRLIKMRPERKQGALYSLCGSIAASL